MRDSKSPVKPACTGLFYIHTYTGVKRRVILPIDFSTVDCSYPPFMWPAIIFHMVDTIMFPLFCNCWESTRTDRARKNTPH